MRPIQHTEHGQYGYAKRTHCDCELCVSCVRRYDKERRLRLYRGQSNRVDSTEARLHVEYLVAAGITYGQIAAATGEKVKESQIRRLIEGNPRNGRQPVRFLYPQTIEALLAVTYRRAASQESKVSPVGTRRRIAALNYMGYGTIDIARLMGVTEEAVRGWTDRDVVLVSTVKRVKEFYDTYSMKPGTNERMRWRAYRQDFVSPMAWDDDTIDDPDAEPDRSVMVCIVGPCRRPIDRMSLCSTHLRIMKERDAIDQPEKYRWHVRSLGKTRGMRNGVDHRETELADLRELGLTRQEAAARSGFSVSYVEKLWGADA